MDTVLYLEGEQFQSYRLLRSVKNRFGATSEVGVFEMQEKGMVEVNPSEIFLAEQRLTRPVRRLPSPWKARAPAGGNQGLTTHTSFGNPRRNAGRVDINRLLLITAVLTRRLGLHLGEQDVFANVVSGLRVSEPGCRPGNRCRDCLVYQKIFPCAPIPC